MNKTKVLSILAITLLILQIFSPNLGLMAESKTTAKSEDNGKVSVKQLDQKDDSIHWKVTVNALGEENNGTKTNVSFSSGHTHGSIEDVREVKVQKTDKGYEIETPAGNDTYELELMTTITSNEQTTFKLETEVDFGEETYKGSDHVIVEKVVPDEVEADEEKEETKEKPNPF